MFELGNNQNSKMNYQSENKIDFKAQMSEDNYLEGLDFNEDKNSVEKAHKERESASFLDGIDTFDEKLKGVRNKQAEHDKEMKRILGPSYQSPNEKFQKVKQDTQDSLKGL